MTREEQRDRLVAAALRVVDEQGLGELTVRRIAEAAGMSTMAVYSGFGGRTGVLEALYHRSDLSPWSPRRITPMPRLPGDPSAIRWLLFAIGFRLPAQNREWVRHELTDYGWRGRTIRRLLVVMIPVCAGLFFLPGPLWLRIMVPAFALIASVGTIAMSADDVRAARLKQHDLEVPDDPDLGHPTH